MLAKQIIPQSDLNKILGDFGLGNIFKIEPLLTSGNITYLLETVKQKYIFRLCPEGVRFRSKEEIEAELELIEYLLKNKFPAPIPIKNKYNKMVINWDSKHGYIKEFDGGKSILDPKINQIKIFGSTFGWFHNLVQDYKTKNKREHIFNLSETKKNFQKVKQIILNSDFNNKEKFVKKLESELSSLSFPEELPKGTIHEDLGKRHVLWKNNKISCILDFDRCYYGEIILDLGQACRGWCFINDWKNWSNQNFESLISGYRDKRKLTNIEKEHLFSAIKFAILERGISFALRFVEITNNYEDQKFAYQSAFDIINLLNSNKEQINRVLNL